MSPRPLTEPAYFKIYILKDKYTKIPFRDIVLHTLYIHIIPN